MSLFPWLNSVAQGVLFRLRLARFDKHEEIQPGLGDGWGRGHHITLFVLHSPEILGDVLWLDSGLVS